MTSQAWKAGDRCWTDCFGDRPRRLEVVYATESHVVTRGASSADLHVLRNALVFRTRDDAMRPNAQSRVTAAEQEVKRHTWNVRVFSKDLVAAKRELAAAKKSIKRLDEAAKGAAK